MLRFFILISIFVASLFAHTTEQGHIHFFSTLHSGEFVVFLAALLFGLGIFFYIKKKA